MLIGSCFTGIGGLDIGLPGQTAWMIESDPFCRRVLQARYPTAGLYPDIRQASGLAQVDLVCGGFPCQDLSAANPRGRGLEGKRSGLWYEMLRIVGEVRPRYVVIENSPRLVRRGLGLIVSQLDELGYVCEATRILARHVGAPHQRDRVFVIATLGCLPPGEDRQGGTWYPLVSGEEPQVGTWRPFGWRPEPVREWPTLTASSYGNNRGGAAGREGQPVRPSLGSAVREWPTLTAKGNHNRAGLSAKSGDGLGTAVAEWPTLTARDGLRGAGWDRPGRPLSERVGGPLNPAWCEAFMGFPRDWTNPDLEPGHWYGWPAGRGPAQYAYEPPRMVPARSVPHRGDRVKALGNAVLPPVARIVGQRITEHVGVSAS